MEVEASPNPLPVKVIRNSGGYVRDNALVVTVNTTIFLWNRYIRIKTDTFVFLNI